MATQASFLNRLRRDRLRFVSTLLLFAQALVPNGFMPVFAEDGPTIMLCTGQGLQRAALPDNSSAAMQAIADAMGEDHAPETDNTPCDYAAAGSSLAMATIFSAAPALAVHGAIPFPPAGLVAIGTGLAAPPPPQTGPPLTF